jgi:hypothetical protein
MRRLVTLLTTVISTEAPVSSVEDRNGGEAEKSTQKQTCPEQLPDLPQNRYRLPPFVYLLQP